MSDTARTDGENLISIVIPMRDEADAVEPLLDGCRAAAGALGPYEICVTDDGSKDGTGRALRDYGAAYPELCLTIVTLPRSAGQSAAIHEAVCASRGRIICTLDGDGQNPPTEIAKLLEPFSAAGASDTLGLVAGQRVKRNDGLSKRLASKFANAIRGTILGDRTRDAGCGLKAFRRDAFLGLPYFDHMHRFLPALFARDGWEVAHVDVAHAPRLSGRSKYNNLQRAFVGITDLLGVAWLIRRRKCLRRAEVEIRRGGARGAAT
ncbi:MAG: glycosyltransferase family 2 protein [Pseudomonadota bacterium]